MYYIVLSKYGNMMIIQSDEREEIQKIFKGRIILGHESLETIEGYLKWAVNKTIEEGVVPFIPDEEEE